MLDLDAIIQIVQENVVLKRVSEKKPVYHPVSGAIVGHERTIVKKLPSDKLRKTHEVRTFKQPGDEEGEKSGAVAVRLSLDDRRNRKRRREHGTKDPMEGTPYEKKLDDSGINTFDRGSSGIQGGRTPHTNKKRAERRRRNTGEVSGFKNYFYQGEN